MDQARVNRLSRTDPREQKKKSPQQVRRQWRERRMAGLAFSAPALGALSYIAYWYFTLGGTGNEFNYKASVSLDLVWAFGLVVFGVFGWAGYGAFLYVCPNCRQYQGHDLTWGLGLIFGSEENRFRRCNYCRMRLE